MAKFPCPYLNADVELTEERETHIRGKHPDLLPAHQDYVAQTCVIPMKCGGMAVSQTASYFPAGFPMLKAVNSLSLWWLPIRPLPTATGS
jgi:hypothetical protein